MTGDYLTTHGQCLESDLNMLAVWAWRWTVTASALRRPESAVAWTGPRGLFVSGSGTDVGKTVTTAALLRALRLGGWAAQAVKPVQTASPQKTCPARPWRT